MFERGDDIKIFKLITTSRIDQFTNSR